MYTLFNADYLKTYKCFHVINVNSFYVVNKKLVIPHRLLT